MMQHGNDMQGLADTLRVEGEFFRTLPAHESARTREANNRIAGRLLADVMAAPAPVQSGGKLWRLSDILEDRTWGDETTLAMIADELRALGWEWSMDAARVRMADKATNLADIVARMRAEAKRMDRAWMAQATETMHAHAAKAVQP